MKMIRIVIVSLVLTAIYSGASAQTAFEVPKQLTLKSPEDFARYEPEVVQAAKWLEETDFAKEKTKRKEVNGFITEWISGTPTVTVALYVQHTKLVEHNIDLLGVYLAAYARHYIENKGVATETSGMKAGLIAMANVYRKKSGISKNKEMEKLLRQIDRNTLDQYIKKIKS